MLNRIVTAAAFLSLLGCQSVQYPDAPKVASSQSSMAVTAHPLASEAARAILASGGNAADAAVAAAFMVAVVEQTMNSIGGRNQILFRSSDGDFHAYNGMTEIPASFVRSENPEADGYGVIAIPGAVASLARLHKEQGSLDWTALLQPAIVTARDGFMLLPGEARRHLSAYPSIKDNPGFQQSVLKPDGSVHKAGEILQQPELANTLELIAEQGADSFYQGAIAQRIAEDMEAHGGFVSLEDLANYQSKDGRYVTTNYRGYDIHSIAAPAGGGLVVKALNILENFDLAEMTETAWAAVVSQALALTVRSMNEDIEELDLERVADKAWAAEQARRITVPNLATQVNEVFHQDQFALLNIDANESDTATMGEATGIAYNGSRYPIEQQLSKNALAMTDWDGSSWGTHSHHTTHFTTADCSGAVVSITQTNGPNYGSKVMTPGLGFVYATTMGTYLSTADEKPGSQSRTTIAPTIVTKDGEIKLVLGAAGGLRILSAIVQSVSRYVDQGLPLDAAVAAPRFQPAIGTDPETRQRTIDLSALQMETTRKNGWSVRQVRELNRAGFEIETNSRYGAFGRVHAIEKTDTGWFGVADLDWEGAAMGNDSGGLSCTL